MKSLSVKKKISFLFFFLYQNNRDKIIPSLLKYSLESQTEFKYYITLVTFQKTEYHALSQTRSDLTEILKGPIYFFQIFFRY